MRLLFAARDFDGPSRLRPVHDRCRLGRSARQPDVGRLRRARGRRGGARSGWDVRQPGLHSEEVLRLRGAFPRGVRRRGGLRLGRRRAPLRLADPAAEQGPRDRAPERRLREAARGGGGRAHRGARAGRRPPYRRGGGPAVHGREHPGRHGELAARSPRSRAWSTRSPRTKRSTSSACRRGRSSSAAATSPWSSRGSFTGWASTWCSSTGGPSSSGASTTTCARRSPPR